MYKQVISPPVHFKLLSKIKEGDLPIIPKNFNVRRQASSNPKCHKLWQDIEGWCKEIMLFQAVEDVVVSEEHKKQLKDKDAEQKQLATCVRKAHTVRERCIHSIIHPELYTEYKASEALYVYWGIAAQLTTAEDGRYTDCEFYTPGKGFSPYFSVGAVNACENNRHSFEFYSMLTRFSVVFPFAYKEDEKAFCLWVDGYDMDVIAAIVKKDKEWVEKKIKRYVEIAKENSGKFLAERSVDDDEEGPEVIPTVRLGGIPRNVKELTVDELAALWGKAVLIREDEEKAVGEEILRRRG